MRSLAQDIRDGAKLSKYRVRDLLSDSNGGNCVMGMAINAALGGANLSHAEMTNMYYAEFWEAQLLAGIVNRAVDLSNHNTDPYPLCVFRPQRLSTEEIAAQVEQWEWEELGIPTKAMLEEMKDRRKEGKHLVFPSTEHFIPAY